MPQRFCETCTITRAGLEVEGQVNSASMCIEDTHACRYYLAVSNVAARGGDNVTVRKFNQTQAGPAERAQEAPSRQAEGDLRPQPGTFTPWEALQIVKAELAANGPVFAEPLEEVLADLGQEPDIDARQARLLAFIDSRESRVEELLQQAMQVGADSDDLIALLSDGTVLPPYTRLVPRSEVAAEVAILLRQVDEPLLHNEWTKPTPGTLLALVLFEGVQAVSCFQYSIHPDLGAQA